MRKELHGGKNVTSCSVGMFWTFWDDELVIYLPLGVSMPVRRPGQPGDRTILTTWLTCKVNELISQDSWLSSLVCPANLTSNSGEAVCSGSLCVSSPDLVLADWDYAFLSTLWISSSIFKPARLCLYACPIFIYKQIKRICPVSLAIIIWAAFSVSLSPFVRNQHQGEHWPHV